MKESSAVILANMKGFKGFERGLIPIAGKPMIEYVLDVIPDEVSNIFIAVDDEKKAEAYEDLAEEYWAKVVFSSSLAGTIRNQVEFAISTADTESVLLLPCDTPLMTRDFTTFLVEASQKFSAVLPRNQARETMYIMASYQRKPFLEAFSKNPDEDMNTLVRKVQKVLYLSSSSLKIFDEKLLMFYRVSNPSDINRVESILRRKK